jgi:hypothetical protein
MTNSLSRPGKSGTAIKRANPNAFYQRDLVTRGLAPFGEQHLYRGSHSWTTSSVTKAFIMPVLIIYIKQLVSRWRGEKLDVTVASQQHETHDLT